MFVMGKGGEKTFPRVGVWSCILLHFSHLSGFGVHMCLAYFLNCQVGDSNHELTLWDPAALTTPPPAGPKNILKRTKFAIFVMRGQLQTVVFVWLVCFFTE